MQDNFVADTTVIIPISAQEDAWEFLLAQLFSIEPIPSVLLVTNSKQKEETLLAKFQNVKQISILYTEGGRGELMNFAASVSNTKYLWFLHADSHLPSGFEFKIQKAMEQKKEAIYYFNLSFSPKKAFFMKINAMGTYLRSHLLKLPFGDQGFFLSKELFFKLGRYRENLKYGEDHLLIWQAHQKNVPVLCIGATIETSARKYLDNGWLKITILHIKLTFFQAFPEFMKYLFKKH